MWKPWSLCGTYVLWTLKVSMLNQHRIKWENAAYVLSADWITVRFQINFTRPATRSKTIAHPSAPALAIWIKRWLQYRNKMPMMLQAILTVSGYLDSLRLSWQFRKLRTVATHWADEISMWFKQRGICQMCRSLCNQEVPCVTSSLLTKTNATRKPRKPLKQTRSLME